MELPRKLTNFGVYVDGRGYVGKTTGVTLPELEIKTEEYQDGGMDAPLDTDMGMVKLEGSITIAEYNPELVKLFGLISADVAVVLRGSIRRQGEDAVPVVIRITGGIKKISRGEWQVGQNSPMTLTYNANRYQEQIANETVVDIDVLNQVRIIGGVDQLASVRTALGT